MTWGKWRQSAVTEEPEKTAATLALYLLEARRKKLGFWDYNFGLGISRRRIEEAAKATQKNDVILDSYIRHIVSMIIENYEKERLTTYPLPTEKEIIDWIGRQGGVSSMLMQ